MGQNVLRARNASFPALLTFLASFTLPFNIIRFNLSELDKSLIKKLIYSKESKKFIFLFCFGSKNINVVSFIYQNKI